MAKELEVKEPIKLEDGKHEGKIVKVEYRGPEEKVHSQYEYTDLHIQEKESGVILRTGVPTYLSPTSKLGKLLAKFLGREITPKEKLVPENILLDKEVTFLTTMEKTDSGEFAKILVDTLKPAVETEKIET